MVMQKKRKKEMNLYFILKAKIISRYLHLIKYRKLPG